MLDYNLVKKANPMKKDDPKKWYAVPKCREAQDSKTMTRAATENTSTSPTEMAAALELLGNYAAQQLLQGHNVRLGDLGTMRIIFKSNGVENIDDFNAGTMIKNPRIHFVAAREFRANVISQLKFQNGGVLEDDINYSSLADYRKAKVGGGGGEVEDPTV